MTIPSVFDVCQPREDVVKARLREADFAADLAQVLRGNGGGTYSDAGRFFTNTYPTGGLRNVLTNVCSRLGGAGHHVAAVFRLDTTYGGGKTHALIALVHAAKGMQGVQNVRDFIADPALVPRARVRVAAFDGENADPANGRDMGQGVRAHTPWGELAIQLDGLRGYRRVERSDKGGHAPGAATMRELFGSDPTLILLDELAVYVRKVQRLGQAADQVTAFLTALIKAVEGAPKAALVYTLAVGKDGKAQDAYKEENELLALRMAELGKVSARAATLLNPTREDETVHVLKRRLFRSVDEECVEKVVAAYYKRWDANLRQLPHSLSLGKAKETMRETYPFHPELLSTLTGKLSTLSNFQRVRGMLRLLAGTIAHLWQQRPADATAIHVHHIDVGYHHIRQELTTRLEQSRFDPAIDHDIGISGTDDALASSLDRRYHARQPPVASYVARTIFMHTLAYPDRLSGIAADHLMYSIISPGLDVGYADQARTRFTQESAYLDDRPGVPLRFQAEANLSQIIRREAERVDDAEATAHLRDLIRDTYKAGPFRGVCFPGGPYDVPDDASKKPVLVILHYDVGAVGRSVETVPSFVQQLYQQKGSGGQFTRELRNNLVFVVADKAQKPPMHWQVRRHLALRALRSKGRINDFEPYQQEKIRELEGKSGLEAATAIQHCYRHVFYPSATPLERASVTLAHTSIDLPSSSDRPGTGQKIVARTLKNLNKLQEAGDPPQSPTFVRDRTQLKLDGRMTTGALRDEFRRNPVLPMLLSEGVFEDCIRLGIKEGIFVYRAGDLVVGQGDPPIVTIDIDAQAEVFTAESARRRGFWPREDVPPEPPEPRPPGPGPPPGPPVRKAMVVKEGLLEVALRAAFEDARHEKFESICKLTLNIYDARDGFALMMQAKRVTEATPSIAIKGEYGTDDGSVLKVEYDGTMREAELIREFLMRQIRSAREHDLQVTISLQFAKDVSAAKDTAAHIIKKLTPIGGSMAEVSVELHQRVS